MNRPSLFPAALALFLPVVTTSAHARDAFADIDVHLSTLGWGLGLAVPVSESVDARVGFNRFNWGYNLSTAMTSATANANVNYAGNIKLSSYDLVADWYPSQGMTHLTAGFLYNDNKLELSATGQYTLNGNTYSQPLTSIVTFHKYAPYLGFGWSNRPKETGFSIKSDFGILFQGAPSASVTATGVRQTDLNTAQASLNDKLSRYRYYPVVSISIGYAF